MSDPTRGAASPSFRVPGARSPFTPCRRILSVTAMLRLSLALLAVVACSAQPPKTAREIAREIVADAHATPVEIFADVVLQGNLLTSLPDKEQVQALEDVFYRAGEAHDPVALRYYALPAHLTAREADRAAVFGKQLDALSIRCRALRLMLKLDAKKAREMLRRCRARRRPRAIVPRISFPTPGFISRPSPRWPPATASPKNSARNRRLSSCWNAARVAPARHGHHRRGQEPCHPGAQREGRRRAGIRAGRIARDRRFRPLLHQRRALWLPGPHRIDGARKPSGRRARPEPPSSKPCAGTWRAT